MAVKLFGVWLGKVALSLRDRWAVSALEAL